MEDKFDEVIFYICEKIICEIIGKQKRNGREIVYANKKNKRYL